MRPGLYPLGVFRDQIHRKGIRALLALVWEKTGLSDFSKSFSKGNRRGCWSWSVKLGSSVIAKRPRKDGKGSERVTQPEGRKGCHLGTRVGTEATRAASELQRPLLERLFIQLRVKAYQDSAETRPWTSGALVWKWQLGGGSCDSGADSSPS